MFVPFVPFAMPCYGDLNGLRWRPLLYIDREPLGPSSKRSETEENKEPFAGSSDCGSSSRTGARPVSDDFRGSQSFFG